MTPAGIEPATFRPYHTVLPDIRNNTALFESFKDFPACPSDKHSIKIIMSIE